MGEDEWRLETDRAVAQEAAEAEVKKKKKSKRPSHQAHSKTQLDFLCWRPKPREKQPASCAVHISQVFLVLPCLLAP